MEDGEQWYYSSMAETKRHIAAPATAAEITRTIGATEEDIRLVNKTFVALGYRDARTGKFVTIETTPRTTTHRAARKTAPKMITIKQARVNKDTAAPSKKGK